ncbi:putative transmembrane protein [Rhodopirellula islandica]|uniref:Transmembrane protein n=2 Tax=Rhodopirellula islandica TaxID=595434 RepID=A0A0J1BMJ3_RHOIS|nr:putative transmembrane protein [Rhodopirellula islandica]
MFGLSANRCGWGFRGLMVAGFLVGGGLLGVSRCLSPSSAGLGTHQQLGLPPCSMRLLFGVRCPACGMTTSWSWLTRGELVASAQANVSGMLLGLFVFLLLLVAVRVAWSGRRPSVEANWWMGFGVVLIGVLSAVEWLVRLQLD